MSPPKSTPLRIAVCRECGWSDPRIRRTVKRLARKHAGCVVVAKKGCLDACKNGPAARVGRKLVAPARAGKLKRLVAKRLSALESGEDRSD